MSGPVGIVEQVTETANQQESAWEGLAVVLYYFSFIAINLGVMNLLPIPGLDGSDCCFCWWKRFAASPSSASWKARFIWQALRC